MNIRARFNAFYYISYLLISPLLYIFKKIISNYLTRLLNEFNIILRINGFRINLSKSLYTFLSSIAWFRSLMHLLFFQTSGKVDNTSVHSIPTTISEIMKRITSASRWSITHIISLTIAVPFSRNVNCFELLFFFFFRIQSFALPLRQKRFLVPRFTNVLLLFSLDYRDRFIDLLHIY